MFLFLSKLLPGLIYPPGFACLMLLIAAISLRRRKRSRPPTSTPILCITLALVYLLISGNTAITYQLVRSLEWQYLPPGDLPKAEAIVVLGGATRTAAPPRPMVDLAEAGDRVFYGAQLYKQGKAPLVILSGGRIHWKGGGAPESADMATIMTMIGVPPSALVQDPTSLNTYENAVNVKQILQTRGIKRILLVTSALHMPRSMAIFKQQGIKAIAAPTDFLVSQQELQETTASLEAQILGFLPDAETLQHFTRALKEYVGLLIYRLQGWL